MKRLYDDYDFEVVPIVIGATGLIDDRLKSVLPKLGIRDIDTCVTKC